MLNSELLFPHSYELREPPKLPGSGARDLPVHYFPPPPFRSEQDGVWVRVSPDAGEEWIGVFAEGYGNPGVTKILSTPNPNRVCIISRGGAYVVNAFSPTEWERLPFLPITYACSIPERRFLLFATFSSLIAWNDGVLWQSHLAVDGLTVTNVSPNRIEGYGYDPALGADDPFLVDSSTGAELHS
jgi:hypothetical protein